MPMSGEKITNTYKRYLVVIFFWEQSPDDKKSKPHPNLRDPSEAEWCFSLFWINIDLVYKCTHDYYLSFEDTCK